MRRTAIRLLRLLAAFVVVAAVWAQGARADGAAEATGEHLTARLVAATTSLAPGTTAHIGVLLRMEAPWHVYWREPGETGLAPTITWHLPEGFRAGALAWPTPTRHVVEGLHSNIYEGEVLLACTLEVPIGFAADQVTIQAEVEWLVCEDAEGCLPGGASLALTLPVAARPPALAPEAALFRATAARLPQAAPEALTLTADATGARLRWEDPSAPDPVEVLWATWTPFDPALEPAPVRDARGWTMSWPFLEGAAPTFLDGLLLVVRDGQQLAHPLRWGAPPVRQAVVAQGPAGEAPDVAASAPPGAAPADRAVPATTVTATSTHLDDDLSWTVDAVRHGGGGDERALAVVLLLALAGGLLLNVMPCVLPVLSLKVLGFVDQAGGDPRATRRHGLVFAAGVVASFLALAGLLLGLRSGGSEIGWGFQLQEPAVVLGLAVLMFLVGLNLVGVFEVGSNIAGLAGRATRHTHRASYAGSFWMGVLTTVIATPCTAPFMGPAIGYAITQPALVALGVFGALGVGMALPYAVLAAFPGWLRFVPRPGPWMETFRQAMAFPMFATVIWLVWLLGRQVGADGGIAVLVALLVVGLGAWLFGRFGGPLRGTRVRWLVGHGVALLVVAAGIGWGLQQVGGAAGGPGAPVAAAPHGWVPYDGHVIAASRARGVPVFLDFTADWCLTCKVNDAVVLESDDVQAAFRRHGVLAMQGDWTTKDARITRALGRVEASSVPLYVIVPSDPALPAHVLRTAITPSYVVQALDEVLAAP